MLRGHDGANVDDGPGCNSPGYPGTMRVGQPDESGIRGVLAGLVVADSEAERQWPCERHASGSQSGSKRTSREPPSCRSRGRHLARSAIDGTSSRVTYAPEATTGITADPGGQLRPTRWCARTRPP